MRSRIAPSIAAAALIVVALGLSPSSGAAVGACGGSAPSVHTCSTGTHAGWNLDEGTHGVAPGPGYVGRLDSTITYAGGARTRVCDYPGSCQTIGSFPPAGTRFTHTCASYQRNSPTPGGSGVWACYVAAA